MSNREAVSDEELEVERQILEELYPEDPDYYGKELLPLLSEKELLMRLFERVTDISRRLGRIEQQIGAVDDSIHTDSTGSAFSRDIRSVECSLEATLKSELHAHYDAIERELHEFYDALNRDILSAKVDLGGSPSPDYQAIKPFI